MKKLIVAVIALSAITFTASAQDQRVTKERKEMHKDGKMKDKMDLNLSDAQKAQLKAHREATKVKADAIKANTSLTQEQRKQQMMELRQTEQAYMQSILTTEQKAKLAGAKANRPQRTDGKEGDHMHKGGMHNGDHTKMKEELALSNAQAAQLKALNMETRDKMKEIKGNTSLSDAEKKAQIKSLKEQTKARHEQILTKEQMEKKKAMRKDHKGGKRGHMKKDYKPQAS